MKVESESIAVRLRATGLEAALPAVADLARFAELVLRANREVNLVSRASASPEELVERHLLDALLALPFLPPPFSGASIRLLDIGSGGGFPALPLLLVRRDVEATLFEATGKKCRFLESAIRELHLTGRVVNARFPAPQMNEHPTFDVLTSRAVADAGGLVRRARPFLTPRARILLWTSESLLPEIRKRTGIQSLQFHRTPGAQVRGLAVLECST